MCPYPANCLDDRRHIGRDWCKYYGKPINPIYVTTASRQIKPEMFQPVRFQQKYANIYLMVDYLNINAVNVEVTYSDTTQRTVVILLAPEVFYMYHSKSSFLMCISIKYTVNVDVHNLIVWIKHLPKRISNT